MAGRRSIVIRVAFPLLVLLAYYVGAVWTGYDINSSLNAYGTNPSCTIWDEVMTKVHQKILDEANAGTIELEKFDLEGTPDIYKTVEEDEAAEE